VFFCRGSTDLSEWFLLPPPQLEALRLAHHCTALFTGFPGHVATFQTPQVFFLLTGVQFN
jgi:hypothetical protein